MDMVGQQDQGIDSERVMTHYLRKGESQPVHIFVGGEQWPPVESDECEEKRGPGGTVAAVAHWEIVLRKERQPGRIDP